jgi:cytoskeletal protein CcmA (bactofilin family)
MFKNSIIKTYITLEGRMKYLMIISLSIGLIILSALTFVGMANAQSFQAGDKITVAKNETVNSMLFAGGNNIDIAGTVNGDVYCAGQSITISGIVKGDVICAGQTVIISGEVDGDVRLAGQNVTISGLISGSATIGSETVFIEKDSEIGRDLLGGTRTATINGKIVRDSTIGAETLIINGSVGRDVKGSLTQVTIGSTGLISGNLDYTSLNDPNISEGGEVKGIVTVYAPEKVEASGRSVAAMTFGWFLFFAMSMVFIGLVLSLLFPRVLHEAAQKAQKNIGATILTGIIAAVSAPAITIMLLISVIGIPLAFIIFLTWLIIVMINAPFVGYMIGQMILKNTTKQPVLMMLVGVGIISIVYFIPIIGVLAMIAVYIFGTGMILNQSKPLLDRIETKKSSKKA